ncbi:O-antigen polysaccharide polymerase Wzy [Amycolatopsis pigmentata]|uniref:O-antigen polysaccharide polymerase Wzy n=1 Tax=Amycolatopsis pigmentata TaxID=450801 RepID=A0ABW5FR47_9PSEU
MAPLAPRTHGRVLPALGLAVVVVLGSLSGAMPTDLSADAAVFFVVWTACLALMAGGVPGGFYRPGAAYLTLFGFFHGGLLLSIALRGPDAFTAYDISWVFAGYTPGAVELALLGMVTFTVATEAASSKAWALPSPREPVHTRLTIVGLACLAVGITIFALALANAGGIGVASGGYLTFIHTNESDGALGYGTVLVGFGGVLGVIAGGRVRAVTWAAFGCYAVVAFMVGSRGAVLFPLLALLVTEVRQGRRIRPLWTAMGSVVVMVLIGLVRQTRSADFAVFGSASLGSPLDALAEMGYSLRPVAATLDWHTAAEPFRHGVTLISVPLRFVENLTGRNGGAPVYDDRLFNLEIAHRVGNIGGSPIAEGYHNFGMAGVVLLMGAIGLAVGLLEKLPRTARGNAIVGVLLLPLLVQVRNSFAAVPVQIGLGVLVLWLVWSGAPERRREGVTR